MKQIGLIMDEEARLEKISKLGDSLERLNDAVNWEMFRPSLNKVFRKPHKGAGGRPAYDYVMLFKILVLQRLYNLSDDQTEYQINDRMSFMRFLGLGIESKIPDAKTIWLFRDTLTKAEVIRELFELFEKQLEEANLITRSGSIVDATFVEAPRPHNHDNETKELKEDKIPEEWTKPENINKLRQKDTDAKWTKKCGIPHYGYKNHVKIDAESKLITNYLATNAKVHDSQAIPALIDERDNVLYGDSAYWGIPVASALPKNVKNEISERGTKYKAMTEEQVANNKRKSKTRCRVEHVFGFIKNSMHGSTLRSIGMKRAEFNIGLTNLIYNICRYEFLKRSAVTQG